MKKLKVLVVDDEFINRAVLKDTLEDLGYAVDTAENGLRGFEKFDLSYAAVISDLQMPVMDGFAFCKKIRAVEEKHHTPIIAATAAALDTVRDGCAAAGMDALVAKPVHKKELQSLLTVLLQKYPATENSACLTS